MSKKISMHQPHFFPWLGYLDKISKSDIFVFLDLVQLEKGSKMYRNIFSTISGEPKFLTIPYIKKGYLDKPYNEILINEDINWRETHKNFILNNYKKSDYFYEIFPILEEFYEKKIDNLSEITIESTKILLKLFNINTEVILQSELIDNSYLFSNEMIIDLCKKTKSTDYLSGIGAKKYIDELIFEKENINIKYQNFKEIKYNKYHKGEFLKDISSLDMLFNIGIDESRKMFKKNMGENNVS